ncbi:hypothetical protein QTL95_28230 [Rhizobium sp. S152]|uniref:hypothetical protein n=1 Tax=Rhizobium sp. S152 TaxID=3055038 RepID=UPI0025AA1114|nr:hypothetical protein [Rhizobium sp. S152]MDM9629776.1 hypothetical protein [Rhizobium sp. S152]
MRDSGTASANDVPGSGSEACSTSMSYHAGNIADELLRAVDGDTAYHVSGALDVMLGVADRTGLEPLCSKRRGDLLAALANVEFAVLRIFRLEDQNEVRRSLAAFRTVVECWNEDAHPSARVKIDHERRLRLRWLQNACFNISIIEELAARAAERRASAVGKLKQLGFANG